MRHPVKQWANYVTLHAVHGVTKNLQSHLHPCRALRRDGHRQQTWHSIYVQWLICVNALWYRHHELWSIGVPAAVCSVPVFRWCSVTSLKWSWHPSLLCEGLNSCFWPSSLIWHFQSSLPPSSSWHTSYNLRHCLKRTSFQPSTSHCTQPTVFKNKTHWRSFCATLMK